MALQSVNPATGETIRTYPESTPQEIEGALGQARAAFVEWREKPFGERTELMRKAAGLLRERKEQYAGLITAEMGKPITEAEAEIEKCAWNCDYYAESAERFLASERVPTNALDSYVEFDPLGVVLAIMPWNFPFWQVFRFAAPALMAGNTALLKHASNVPGCALAIEEMFRDAGFRDGAFRSLLISGQTAEELIADPRIAAVTLTGSDVAGARVAAAAGRAIKPCVLELGGSDPFIVLESADLQAAADTAARARNMNAGQSCIAAKRFIVVERVAGEFERLFCEAVAALKVGDPADRATQVGPLARADLRDALQSQVERSVKTGAQVAVGGRPQDGPGFYYEPTVLTDVTPEMAVFSEETFGPVAAVRRVRDVDEAVELANRSAYGLGASIWTRNDEEGRAVARRIESGMVFVNGMVASDPRLPFGGIKRSGYGRELSSFGIHEFVNIKTVWVGPAPSATPAAQQIAQATE